MTHADRAWASPPEVAGLHALVLAAGLGTRLRPIVGDQPKPLVPVAGVPVVERSLEWLAAQGVHQAALNLHYRAAEVRRHVERNHPPGMDVTFSLERELRGTAGACWPLRAFLGSPFVVMYGDVVTDLPLAPLLAHHAATAAELTMALYRVANPTECGIVEVDAAGLVIRCVEKPEPDAVFSDLANSGILVVEQSVFDAIPSARPADFGRDLIPALLAAGRRVAGWEMPVGLTLIDVGTPEGYARAQAWLAAPQERA